jgi:hypothetical protein
MITLALVVVAFIVMVALAIIDDNRGGMVMDVWGSLFVFS